MGRLWQVSTPSSVVRFLYDGDRLAGEYDAFGSVLRGYVHGTGPDEPLVWYEVGVGNWRRYLHADHQGSIIAIADQDGNPIAINAYDAWGIPNSGNLGRFGYTGQAWLPELGMWYYKARIYSPTLGRFLQTDPVGYVGGINIYSYADDDPINSEDPNGLTPDTPDKPKDPQTPSGCGTRIAGQSTSGCLTYAEAKSEDGARRRPTRSLLPPPPVAAPATASQEGLLSRALGVLARAGRGSVLYLTLLLSGDTRQEPQARFIRYMSRNELAATQRTGLLRGGRPGTSYFTSEKPLSSSSAAADRYSLPVDPEVAVMFRFPIVPPFATGSVDPDGLGHHGGGVEHWIEYPMKVEILGVRGLNP
jgi:RHS repeat-associated protein